jgi:selenium donor protein
LLSEILSKAPLTSAFPNLLVGTESCDDAAVYRLNETQAIVATTDFFMPIVDDAFDFGRIAATNAISDVYAMGAKPFMALALLGMPVGRLYAQRRAYPSPAAIRSTRLSLSTVWSRSDSCIPIASSAMTAHTRATC